MDFCRELVREENVFVLPGSSFGVPNTIRIAFGAHESILEKASSRIAEFCHRHTRQEVLLLQGGADPQQQHNNETE
jgi:aspartate/methionine/tyrosine aminotransferase